MNNIILLFKVRVCGLEIQIVKLVQRISPRLANLLGKYVTRNLINLCKEYLSSLK